MSFHLYMYVCYMLIKDVNNNNNNNNNNNVIVAKYCSRVYMNA